MCLLQFLLNLCTVGFFSGLNQPTESNHFRLQPRSFQVCIQIIWLAEQIMIMVYSLISTIYISYKVYVKQRSTLIMENKQNKRDTVDNTVACVTDGKERSVN